MTKEELGFKKKKNQTTEAEGKPKKGKELRKKRQGIRAEKEGNDHNPPSCKPRNCTENE